MGGDANLDQAQVRQTITTVLRHAAPALVGVQYCLVGTAAAVLRGVPLPAGDIDLIMKERVDVDSLGAALAVFPCVTPPTLLAEARQYYAAYNVHGVQVDISTVEWETNSECIETLGVGPWKHSILIPCDSYAIPTIALELRLVSELLRDRPDRYMPLIQWMHTNGCDIDLLKCAMDGRSLPRARQIQVLNQIRPEK